MSFNQEHKQDAGKIRAGLIPPAAMESMAKVLTFGANKYGAESWKQVEPVRYKDALMRHLIAYLENPKSKDEESGLLHIEHALCNAAFLCHFTRLGNEPMTEGETNSDKNIPHLTLEQVATVLNYNTECATCIAKKFCATTETSDCAGVFAEWLKQEVDHLCPQPNE